MTLTTVVLTIALVPLIISSAYAGECHVHNKPAFLSLAMPSTDAVLDGPTVSNFANNLVTLLGLSSEQSVKQEQPLLYSTRPLEIPSSTWLFHVEGLDRLFQQGLPLEDNRDFDINSIQSMLLGDSISDTTNIGTIIISSESDVDNLEQSLKNQVSKMNDQAPIQYIVIVCDYCQSNSILQKLQSNLNNTIRDIVAKDPQTLAMTLTTRQSARVRRARALNNVNNNVTIATMYSTEYSTMFNIFFWTTLALAIVLIAVVYVFLNMDPGSDTIIYRMTTPRLKVD